MTDQLKELVTAAPAKIKRRRSNTPNTRHIYAVDLTDSLGQIIQVPAADAKEAREVALERLQSAVFESSKS